MQDNIQYSMGISRDMNFASTELVKFVGDFLTEMEAFVEGLERLNASCEEKEHQLQLQGLATYPQD
jgi:hypothetical protein